LGSTSNGNIAVNAIAVGDTSSITGIVSFIATQDDAQITFGSSPSSFRTLAAQADNGIVVTAATITTTYGSVYLDADADNDLSGDSSNNLQFSAGVTVTSKTTMTLESSTGETTASGALTLAARTGIVLGAFVGSGGYVKVYPDSELDGTGIFTVLTSKVVNTGSGIIEISTEDLDLQGGISTGTASALIVPSYNTDTIGIGVTSGFGISISRSEMARTTGTGVTVGSGANGNMQITGLL